MSVDAVRRLVRDRAALQPGFARLQSRLARETAAEVDIFSGATLALSHVGAGLAGIEALWRAGQGTALSLASAGGYAAADVCRYAGARAALACLDALPTVVRLTDAEGFDCVWLGLKRLAREAPGAVLDVAGRLETLLGAMDGRRFADFIAAGLKATARDPRRRAAFFALQDPFAQALLRGGTGFDSAEPMLRAFVAGLWGVEPRLKAAPSQRRTMIAAGIVLLPADGARALYRARVAHAYAHLTIPAVRQAAGSLRPLQVALVGLIEDARVEALAIRRFPGLRRMWAGFHAAQPGGVLTAEGLMARLARALLDPGYDDPDGFVAKGRLLFAACQDRLDDPAISRAIGGLLGNDLGQMRLPFNAKTYVTEPAYRDDNMHLWTLPETPDDALAMTVDAARGNDDGQPDRPGGGDAAPVQRARDAGLDDKATLLATYPEWDSAAGVERPDWTSLRDVVPRLADPALAWTGEASLRSRIARLVRGTVVGRSVRQPPREAGEELDIDAAIRASIARRMGTEPDGRVYRDRRPVGRDLATLIIMDVSQSTAAVGPAGLSVLAAERLAVGALAAALEARGDRYAVRAFASSGRDDVRLTRVKDFDERWSDIVSARLAGLTPGFSTRLGAALRHAGAELGPLRTTRKMLLVLTDGEPSDIDVARPAELIEDARRAVMGLRRQGIDVFGIVMDPEDAGSGTAIFGRHNAMDVRRLEELPNRLAGVYFRLALR